MKITNFPNVVFGFQSSHIVASEKTRTSGITIKSGVSIIPFFVKNVGIRKPKNVK